MLASYLESVNNRDATMSNIIHTSLMCTSGEPEQVCEKHLFDVYHLLDVNQLSQDSNWIAQEIAMVSFL